MTASERPRPDTAALLIFLDFIYAFVVAHVFLPRIYEVLSKHSDAIPACFSAWSEIFTDGRWLVLLLSVAVFYFIATDWMDARVLNELENYRTYIRFWLDLTIACFSYGALLLATIGNVGAGYYLAVMYLAGAIWALVAIIENPKCETAPKFRLLLITHLFGAFAFFLFSHNYRHADSSPKAMLAFLLLLAVVFAIEEVLHVWLVPERLWVGPSCLPIPRGAIKGSLQWIKQRVLGRD